MEYIIITVDGKETKCPIIFTFDSKEFNHKYVVFQHGDSEEISAMIYEEKDATSGTLMPIESDEEWDMVEGVLDTFLNDENMQ